MNKVMSEHQPQLSDQIFSISQRIYYEDTDAGGIVYYANYLALMERARSEFLRHVGFSVSTLLERFGLMFVVAEVNIKYRKPAHLDDLVDVTLQVQQARSASIWFAQKVTRDDALLVEASVRVGIIRNDTFLPAKLPDQLSDLLKQFTIK